MRNGASRSSRLRACTGVDDRAFKVVDLSYRVIPGDIEAGDLTMTHSSVHFDRTGFREDVNLVFRSTGSANSSARA